MQTSKYLYGEVDKELLQKRKEIAKEFKEAANKLISILYKVPLKPRDDDRLNAVIKARDFNQRIIDEEV